MGRYSECFWYSDFYLSWSGFRWQWQLRVQEVILLELRKERCIKILRKKFLSRNCFNKDCVPLVHILGYIGL